MGQDIGKEMEIFDEGGSRKRSARQQLLLAKRTQQFGWNIAVADELAFAARKPLALVSERPDRNDDVFNVGSKNSELAEKKWRRARPDRLEGLRIGA